MIKGGIRKLIIELIDTIHRFLGYLNINLNYLNKLYTIVAALPIFYHIKLLTTFWKEGSYTQFILFILLLILFLYFWLLNVLYYFFNKNSKLDITQFIATVVPDEVFDEDIEDETIERKNYVSVDDYTELELFANKLMEDELIPIREEIVDGYVIDMETMIPVYILTQDGNDVSVKVGIDYDNLFKIGVIKDEVDSNIIALYLVGGYFYDKGNKFKDKYRIEYKIKTA